MKSLINGFGGGFGRVFGRIIAYFVIGYIIYYLINYFNIDISKYIKILTGGILWKN